MAELRKALEKVGTRVHKRGPNLKNWTIRKVAAGPVRLTTSECLTKGPVLAISTKRESSLSKTTAIESAVLSKLCWWMSVCQRQMQLCRSGLSSTGPEYY